MPNPTDPVRIILIDDDPLSRTAIATYLSPVPWLEVVQGFADVSSAVAFLHDHPIDLALVDVSMPVVDGVEGVARVKEAAPDTTCLMLTSFDDPDLLRRSIAVGAAGYLLKTVRPQQLVIAIRAALDGMPALSPELLRHLGPHESEVASASLPSFTARESEVLEHLWRGSSNAEIARTLYVSESAVKAHVHVLMVKLGVDSRLKVVAEARARGYRPAVP